MVGTKAFVFSLVMMPILMFGGFLVMPALQKVSGNRELKIVVADGTKQLYADLEEAAKQYNQAIKNQSGGSNDGSPFQSTDIFLLEPAESPILDDEQRLKLSQLIKDGKVYAFVEIPENLFEKPEIPQTATSPSLPQPKFYSFDSIMSSARRWIGSFISQKVRNERIKQFGLETLDPAILRMVQSEVDISANRPLEKEKKAESQSATDALKQMFLPFGVMMLMFLVIFMAAQPMLESAMEEKTLRISEVLIGSVTPTQLMGGKLIGNVAGSMVIFILYGCGGLFVLNKANMLSSLPMNVIPWFIVFQVLGVLFFSSIFLVVGSSVNELKEAQSLLLPVWMMLMFPVMVWFIAVRDPNGVVAVGLSFFPPSCPLMTVLRLASGTAVPWWHPVLGAFIMVVATTFMVILAGRIYRVGLLKTDGVRSILQLLKRASGQ
jgi:ABC-2 type transport system permease protein